MTIQMMKQMTKQISIIIPMYNAQAYIKRCIGSVLDQGFEDLEVIVVDDGSADDSCLVAGSFGDGRIRLVSQGRKGVSWARNTGLDLAQGRYIIFMDADDQLLDHALKTMYDTISSNKADLAVFGYINEKNGVKYEKRFEAPETMGRDAAFIQVFRTPAFRGVLWNKIFVRERMEESHIRFPAGYTHGEDLVFVTEYLKQCTRICVDPRLVYMYAENPNSLCRQMYHVNAFNDNYLILYEAEKAVYTCISRESSAVLHAFAFKHVETCIDILNRLAHFGLFRHQKVKEISKDVRKHAKQYLFTRDQYPKKWINVISVLLISASGPLFMRVYHVVKKIAWSLGFRSKV